MTVEAAAAMQETESAVMRTATEGAATSIATGASAKAGPHTPLLTQRPEGMTKKAWKKYKYRYYTLQKRRREYYTLQPWRWDLWDLYSRRGGRTQLSNMHGRRESSTQRDQRRRRRRFGRRKENGPL